MFDGFFSPIFPPIRKRAIGDCQEQDDESEGQVSLPKTYQQPKEHQDDKWMPDLN
jgi:hypothetical protein